MRHFVFALGFFLTCFPAYAQHAGEACQKFGQTIEAQDKKRALACLRANLGAPAAPLVWRLNTVAPKAWIPNRDGLDPFYTIGPERKAGE